MTTTKNCVWTKINPAHAHTTDENGATWCPAVTDLEPRVEIPGAFWTQPRIQRDGECYWAFGPSISDEQAASITFRADPKEIRLGAYAEVTDGGGIRIGHVATAVYHEPAFGPGYVVCTIKLS